jgi:hypothetical protein
MVCLNILVNLELYQAALLITGVSILKQWLILKYWPIVSLIVSGTSRNNIASVAPAICGDAGMHGCPAFDKAVCDRINDS